MSNSPTYKDYMQKLEELKVIEERLWARIMMTRNASERIQIFHDLPFHKEPKISHPTHKVQTKNDQVIMPLPRNIYFDLFKTTPFISARPSPRITSAAVLEAKRMKAVVAQRTVRYQATLANIEGPPEISEGERDE